MRKKGRILCLLLAVMLSMQTLVLSLPKQVWAAEPADVQTYYVTPELSDGLTMTSGELPDLAVKGTLSGETFTFAEDKTLSFAATAAEGWTYSSDYSRFFASDAQNRSIVQNGKTVTFTYQAKKGKSVAFSDLAAVLINATPDKLPQLKITIDGSFSSVNKEDWTAASFELTAGTKVFAEGNSYTGTGEIKGRGNSSWQQPQKPYSIKLSKKESLLGIPKTKKYAIVSTYSDPSLMRNYVTYKAALSLVGIQYVPKIEFVEVYLNGSYNGVYALVERIDIESTKIDIEEATADNLTGGYIIEKDAGDKVNKNVDPWFDAPFQANPNEDLFTLKAPDVQDGMLEYLEDYMQRLHDALMGNSDESYTKYIDISSWADFLVLQELAKNVDGNLKTSCYFVKEKDNDVLRMDAPWDFDLAYGLANWSNASQYNDYWDCPTGTGTSDFMVINSSCPWFKQLYSFDEFNSLVKERYSAYRAEMIPNMHSMIYEQAAYLSKAAQSNSQKWPAVGSFSYGVSSFDNWLKGRVEWLDAKWLDESKQTLALSVSADGDGTGTVQAPDAVAYGKTAEVSITADAGSEIASVVWNGIDVTEEIQNGAYTTPIMTKDAELAVTFQKVQAPVYAITIAGMANGNVAADKETASAGEVVTLTVTPEEEYRLTADSLKVNGGAVAVTKASETAYMFVMPSGGANVTASFEKILYTITIAGMANGSVAADKETASAGEVVTLTVTPEEEYRLTEDSLKVNGGAVAVTKASETAYTFVMPSGGANVTASFEKIPVPAVTNIMISPEYAEVAAGETQQFTAEVFVENGASQAAAWSVSGALSAQTSIDENGLLTVGEDETAEMLTVTAMSVFDPSVQRSVTVTVKQTESSGESSKPEESKPEESEKEESSSRPDTESPADKNNPNTDDALPFAAPALLLLAAAVLMALRKGKKHTVLRTK